MNSDTILVSKEGGVTKVTLNRPEKLNSFNDEMHQVLYAAMKDAAEDPVCRTVLLTGAGRAFCAGQDLGDRDPSKMDGPPDLGETLEKFYNPLIRMIRDMNKPVICAVNGVAAGAGANIALACDIIIAAKSVKFIQAFCKIGLVPDSGGTWSLTKLLGEARAKALMLTGTPIMAEQAADWGMIWQVVEDDQLMDVATKQAQEFASGPTIGLALTKQAIHAAATTSLDQQLNMERDFQRRAGRSSDYAEGVSAFIQKRKPEFTGQE
ncbi:2-(1,2-epoxy-1,2-dihydrophenyl)acetyl-CoA isomerase PaaG [Curvivirga aplysinae]|uniref:2-(1,2-epoxy-1,2-dihydrophenyl)acetyl-CoA isomerase PaaG n=1 Tax=Curvivirga aplysinae TaxID=2529852 RepID=UPI0012BB9D39|nr:2-(1,2-epoxy-1,2-dihydrophenyl)acetyl-CoA isomerase PaaG [Curvivirga aplysinae]